MNQIDLTPRQHEILLLLYGADDSPKIKNIRNELFKRQSYIEISDSEMEEMIEDLHVLESKCVANPMITSKQLREVCDLIDYIEQFQLVQV